MLLYIDPSTNQVEHTAYRKPLNHMERIPRASHHPPDVKKARRTRGEMSRLAVLSSKDIHYLDALKGLKSLYIARGYPIKILNSWLKANSDKRWRQRLEEPIKGTDELFVLKSEFNPIWETFTSKDMFFNIKNAWRRDMPHIEKCDLQGRCGIHNSATTQHLIPNDLKILENKRIEASIFKYSIADASALVVDTHTTPKFPLETRV